MTQWAYKYIYIVHPHCLLHIAKLRRRIATV